MRKTVAVLLFFCIAAVIAVVTRPWDDAEQMPDGFVYVCDVVPGAVLDVRYYTANNFVGAPVDGYLAPQVILTSQAATKLAAVQQALAPFGLGLKVFDGYRPQRAVDHFVRWAEALEDTVTKAEYYPDVPKENLFRDGYIASKSGHSRGSTVDVTLVDLQTKIELDMGTPFDFFGLQSWPEDAEQTGQVRANRALLQGVMMSNGFKPLSTEWWHFTLKDEPYPETYFDFPVQ